LWKNSFVIAKDVCIISVMVIVIATAFSEKKLEALLLYYSSYINMGFTKIVYIFKDLKLYIILRPFTEWCLYHM
jgi:hypothetical protein